jgi:hypothetical protein
VGIAGIQKKRVFASPFCRRFLQWNEQMEFTPKNYCITGKNKNKPGE